PSFVSSHTVCGLLFAYPFSTSTSFASCSIARCRLKFPSVSLHSTLRSLNVSPPACEASDAMMLKRAFSWITRSKPSYAYRPALPQDQLRPHRHRPDHRCPHPQHHIGPPIPPRP